MSEQIVINPGIYRHYKGRNYEAIGVGKDTETLEDVVIYRPLYDSEVAFWVRPLAMFCDSVTVDGIQMPRFRKVDQSEGRG